MIFWSGEIRTYKEWNKSRERERIKWIAWVDRKATGSIRWIIDSCLSCCLAWLSNALILLCVHGQSTSNTVAAIDPGDLWRTVVTEPLQVIVFVALQVLCVRSMRCKASGVDDGDPSAPRTEKTTAHDCVLLSPRNQVYHDPQSSQVVSVCACVCRQQIHLEVGELEGEWEFN